MSQETYLFKGTQLYERICALSASMESSGREQSKLLLSFDLYCLLLEYTALVGRLNSVGGAEVEELFQYDDLIFDTGNNHLAIAVDFLASPETIIIS
jgi:hypothetical protein